PDLTKSVGTVNDRSPLVAWTSGTSALTSTVSVVPPTASTTVPRLAVTPGLTGTPDCLAVLKDGIVISTVYVSTGVTGNVKSPVSFVTAGADLVPFVSLMSVTVAPGITPPCASLTVPT